jgi:hypothetical protein
MFLTLLEFWQGCLAQDYIVSLEWTQDGWELSKMRAVFLLKPAQVFHLIESRLRQFLLQLRSHSREVGAMGSVYTLSPDSRSSSYTERRLHMNTSFAQTLSITFTYMVTVEASRLERGGDPEALAQRKHLFQAVLTAGDQPLRHLIMRQVSRDLKDTAEREEFLAWLTGYEPDEEEPLLPALSALSLQERVDLDQNMPDALYEHIEDAFQAVLNTVTVSLANG